MITKIQFYLPVFTLALFLNLSLISNASGSIKFEINGDSRTDVAAPVFISPTNHFLLIDTLCVNYSITITAVDFIQAPIVLTATGLPPGATMTPPLPASGNPVTSVFNWVPDPFNLNVYNIRFTATDTWGSQTYFDILVDFPLLILPDPPIFLSPTPTCGSVFAQNYGNNISFEVRGWDEDYNDETTLSVSGLPLGATMNPPLPATGNPISSVFSWTPLQGQAGPHTVTFTATDMCGQQRVCSYTFDILLPVELSSFTSSSNSNEVTLNWTTSIETGNLKFEIERANSGSEDWRKLGIINGNGNSSIPISYSFKDRNLDIGSYVYRLKQIDFNGNFEYHSLNGEVIVGVPSKFELSQNYPNPFNPETKINFEIPEDGNINLSVYDNRGKLISIIVSEFRAAGYYTELFKTFNMASGVYYYKLQYNNSGKSFEKVMKMVIVK